MGDKSQSHWSVPIVLTLVWSGLCTLTSCVGSPLNIESSTPEGSSHPGVVPKLWSPSDLVGCSSRASTLNGPLVEGRPLLSQWDVSRRFRAPETPPLTWGKPLPSPQAHLRASTGLNLISNMKKCLIFPYNMPWLAYKLPDKKSGLKMSLLILTPFHKLIFFAEIPLSGPRLFMFRLSFPSLRIRNSRRDIGPMDPVLTLCIQSN
jgi:hypothetical protein